MLTCQKNVIGYKMSVILPSDFFLTFGLISREEYTQHEKEYTVYQLYKLKFRLFLLIDQPGASWNFHSHSIPRKIVQGRFPQSKHPPENGFRADFPHRAKVP